MAFALGLDEASDKIYFNQFKSLPLALRSASWQSLGALDAHLPITFSASAPAIGFQDVLDNLIDLQPIVSITSSDFFSSDLPKISVDFDLEQLINGTQDLIANIFEDLTGGLANISSSGGPDFAGGPFGSIAGILDRFDIAFPTRLLEEFKVRPGFVVVILEKGLPISLLLLIPYPEYLNHFPR